MTDTVFNVILALLASGIIIWFILVSRYFRYLREKHPQTYARMGSPSLIMNNTPSNNIRFVKYICSDQCDETGDDELVAKTRTLRFILFSYTTVFAGLALTVFTIGVTG